MKKLFRILGVITLVLTIPLAVYITTSVGVDYVHGFGKACAVYHDGWDFHGKCGVEVPLSP